MTTLQTCELIDAIELLREAHVKLVNLEEDVELDDDSNLIGSVGLKVSESLTDLSKLIDD